MPALLINIKIEEEDKFNLFKITLLDMRGLFNECHVKIRGSYSQNCIEYAKECLNTAESLFFYQDLQQNDWIDATLKMLANVRNRSVFLFFEDHKLVATRSQIKETLNEFDQRQLDYLCYSWFQASRLNMENILPLNPERGVYMNIIQYSKNTNQLVGKISPNYCHFTLMSICSVNHFKSILNSSNKRFKYYNRILSYTLSRLFPHPAQKKILNSLNYIAKKINVYLCYNHPSSPFNLEKMWFESIYLNRTLRFGILKNELYANYDDDNGYYKESLIKRGLYPFTNHVDDNYALKSTQGINFSIELKDGELYECRYFSQRGRIRKAPLVNIMVEDGNVLITCQTIEVILKTSESQLFYSNQAPLISSIGASKIKIEVFDEAF